MLVSVTGPKGGSVDVGLHATTELAVKHYAKQLGISRLRNNILVRIHHRIDVGEWGTEGLCECIDNRNYILDIALYSNWLLNLAHEMVHVKQFARNELDPFMTSWKSNKYVSELDYWRQPWEKEARRLQSKLLAEYSNEVA